MKGIEFIKRNISLFNVLSTFIFLISLFILLTMKPEDSSHGMASRLLIQLLLFSLILFFIDFLMRRIIKNESSLFVIQLLLIFIISFLIYYLIP